MYAGVLGCSLATVNRWSPSGFGVALVVRTGAIATRAKRVVPHGPVVDVCSRV